MDRFYGGKCGPLCPTHTKVLGHGPVLHNTADLVAAYLLVLCLYVVVLVHRDVASCTLFAQLKQNKNKKYNLYGKNVTN